MPVVDVATLRAAALLMRGGEVPRSTSNGANRRALFRALSWIGLAADAVELVSTQTRLRLAIHLAPRAAISYDPKSSISRRTLISRHLNQEFPTAPITLRDELARQIATILDRWSERRSDVSGYLDTLLRRGGNTCANCRVRFSNDAQSLTNKDPYKPYYLAPDELLRPEVDHVDPVSFTGTNEIDNLQILCRICNSGKGDGTGVDCREELRHSGCDITLAGRMYRFQLIYYVIARDGRQCSRCGANSNELTIRPTFDGCPLVTTRMTTICYQCTYEYSSVAA